MALSNVVVPQDWLLFLRSMGPSERGFRGRNIGNGYIGWAMMKLLEQYPDSFEHSHLPNIWESDLPRYLVDYINTNHDSAILVCQDFMRAASRVFPFERVNAFLRKIKIPLVPVSLGANWFGAYDTTLHEKFSKEQIEFLKILGEQSKFIGVRSPIGAEVLAKLGIHNVSVVGCPTYFESGANRVIKKPEWGRIVTTGDSFPPKYPNCAHILQDEIPWIEKLMLDKEVRPLEAKPYGKFCWENLDRKIANGGEVLFFWYFEDWQYFYETHKPCLTIGTRLHSAIFALNRGYPAICTNGDARASSMCDFLGIPHQLMPQDSDLEQVYNALDLTHMNELYETRRVNFLSFLQNSGLISMFEPSFD